MCVLCTSSHACVDVCVWCVGVRGVKGVHACVGNVCVYPSVVCVCVCGGVCTPYLCVVCADGVCTCVGTV